MALEALSSNELLNFIIYDTISATSFSKHEHVLETSFAFENYPRPPQQHDGSTKSSCLSSMSCRENLVVQGKKKRKRKPRACKNKEEAETQRMTHISVERNRRRQMNDHLGVLRSLMPKSYVQRGDQASIVGGAIEFVKELEQLLQSLEAQKLQLLQGLTSRNDDTTTSSAPAASNCLLSPFSQLFAHPHEFSWSQLPNKYTSATKAATADIEATLIEKHANLRILTRRRLRQLSKLVTGFQTVQLTILHLNVTTMDPLVLYSISAKVEEGCQLTSVDDIAGAVQHMLRIIEEEVVLC